METAKINELSIAGTKVVYEGSFINDDLLLINDFANLPLPNEPRRVKCIIVGLCLHGKAQYSVDTEDRNVHPNDVIMIHNGQVLDNYMLSPDFHGIGIMLSEVFYHEIIKDIHELSSLFLFSRSHPVFNLSADESFMISQYYKALQYKVDDQNHHFRTEAVRSFFIKLVEENFRRERRVSWYGERLFITPKYLSETVKLVSQKTPNEWIDNYVLLEIRVLLKNTTMNIKEIAQQLNFPNQSFLGKYFKEHVGMSPSEYRKI